MEFPLHKEWMGELNKVGAMYLQGAKEFVNYAKRSLKSEVFSCPCTRCRNGKCWHWEIVHLHLVKWGIQQHYTIWNFHGERDFPFVPEEILPEETMQVDADRSTHPRLNDLIDEAYGVHILQASESSDIFVNCEDDEDHQRDSAVHVDARINNDNDYIQLKFEASRPLYPNCNADHTTLFTRTQKKTKTYHPSAVATVERLNEIRSTQVESNSSSKDSIDSDALAQIFGKDKKGRTRGVSSTVSRTTLMATLPVRSELEKVKADVKSSNLKMDHLQSSMDSLINLYEANAHINVSSGSRPLPTQPNEEHSSSHIGTFPSPRTSVPTSGADVFYNIRDLRGTTTIAIGTIESRATVGTVVHSHPMKPHEAKVNVIRVLQGMDREKLWLGNQGCADSIGEVVGGFMVWPIHLLEKKAD